ncbi:hypothetical protein JOD45_002199 [Scopulibacillus daqui]|uniref:Uncharacterized protein n=1 Tax=Scopulibacillus daqui TaxID=1469162 RepID=A0ABS2Q0Z5_9BACL|nr:hypothetical protein [Scopulibacillus daqui]
MFSHILSQYKEEATERNENMGRSHHRKKRDKNKQDLPQTPKYEKNPDGQDLELAKELSDRYELKAKPGFPPMDVDRK